VGGNDRGTLAKKPRHDLCFSRKRTLAIHWVNKRRAPSLAAGLKNYGYVGFRSARKDLHTPAGQRRAIRYQPRMPRQTDPSTGSVLKEYLEKKSHFLSKKDTVWRGEAIIGARARPDLAQQCLGKGNQAQGLGLPILKYKPDFGCLPLPEIISTEPADIKPWVASLAPSAFPAFHTDKW